MDIHKFVVLAGSRILVRDKDEESVLFLCDDVEVQSTKHIKVRCTDAADKTPEEDIRG